MRKLLIAVPRVLETDMSPFAKLSVSLPLLVYSVGCVGLLAPVNLTRVDSLVWESHEVSPIEGVTLLIGLPRDSEPVGDNPIANCTAQFVDGNYAYKLCNAPLAYYPARYGWVVNYGVYMDTQQNPKTVDTEYTNSHGVRWRLVAGPMKDTGGVVSAFTTLPTGARLMIQTSSTVKIPDGYLAGIAREGTERFQVRIHSRTGSTLER